MWVAVSVVVVVVLEEEEDGVVDVDFDDKRFTTLSNATFNFIM